METFLSCGGYRRRSKSRDRSYSQAKIIFKGWLVKSPPISTESGFRAAMRPLQPKWHRRYFVLSVETDVTDDENARVHRLQYFKDEQQMKKMGFVDLKNTVNITTLVALPEEIIRSIPHKHTQSKVQPFPVFTLETLHKNRERTYYFIAESMENMERWVDHLTLACELREEGGDEEDYYPDPQIQFPSNTIVSMKNAYPRGMSQQQNSVMGYNTSMMMGQHPTLNMRGSAANTPNYNPNIRQPSPGASNNYNASPSLPRREPSNVSPNTQPHYPPLPKTPVNESVYGVPSNAEAGYEDVADGIYRINSPTRIQSAGFDAEDVYKVPTGESVQGFVHDRESVYRVPVEAPQSPDANCYMNFNEATANQPTAPQQTLAVPPRLTKPRKYSLKYKNKPLVASKSQQPSPEKTAATTAETEKHQSRNEDEAVKRDDYVNVSTITSKLKDNAAAPPSIKPRQSQVHQTQQNMTNGKADHEDEEGTIILPKRRTQKSSESSSDSDDEKEDVKKEVKPAAAKANYINLDMESLNQRCSEESSSTVSIQYTEVDTVRTQAISEMQPRRPARLGHR